MAEWPERIRPVALGEKLARAVAPRDSPEGGDAERPGEEVEVEIGAGATRAVEA